MIRNGHAVHLAVLLASVLPALACADAQSHRQEVETLFKLTRMEAKINESVDTVLALQIQQNPQLAQHQDALRAFLERHIGWNSMKAPLTEMYVKMFTEQELKEMNAFYTTPTGQKVILQLPDLVQARNRLAMQRIQENIGELQKEIAHQPAE